MDCVLKCNKIYLLNYYNKIMKVLHEQVTLIYLGGSFSSYKISPTKRTSKRNNDNS